MFTTCLLLEPSLISNNYPLSYYTYYHAYAYLVMMYCIVLYDYLYITCIASCYVYYAYVCNMPHGEHQLIAEYV